MNDNQTLFIMKKKLCCRCLTESKTGYGNFNRCLIIAKSLKKNLIDIIFLIDNNPNIITKLKNEKFEYFIIPNNTKKNTEHFFINNFMIKKEISTILIDMREYGEIISKQLKKNGQKIILLDDVWSKKIYSDLFFNSTNIKTLKNYKKMNPSSKLFLGLKYLPIDKNFLKYKKKITDIKNKNFLNLVISMGGSDPNNLTYSILESIKNIDKINICVIVGPMFQNNLKLNKLILNQKNIKLINSPKNFFKELSKSDIAITNGGNTLFESIALRIPTISIPAFKHEILYAKKFSDQHCIINLGFQQKNSKKIKLCVQQLISHITLRKNLFISTNRIIDGNGIDRISNNIIKFLD